MNYLRPFLNLMYKAKKEFFGMFVILIVLIVTYNEIWLFNKINKEKALRIHSEIIEKFMKDREKWNTSVLGSWLFKKNQFVRPQHRRFLIHVHNETRIRDDYYEDCSVNNCNFTKDDSLLPIVDAVLVSLRRGFIPNRSHRHSQQRWIFLNLESPSTIRSSSPVKWAWKDLADIFNWSMSYRTDSDIPYPYGRILPLKEPVLSHFDLRDLTAIIPHWKRKRRDVLVTILVTRCFSFRMNLITELQKHMAVDVFGKCAKNNTLKYGCPGYLTKDCDQISEYLFYLALENSDCRGYLTEKIWYNAFMKGAIPIIMGPTLRDCVRLLPPNSFLFVPKNHNRTVIEELAKNLKYLSKDNDALLSLHKWRNHFNVTYDHDTFGMKSLQLCRICEGLNYNDHKTKIYKEDEIIRFLDPKLLCGK